MKEFNEIRNCSFGLSCPSTEYTKKIIKDFQNFKLTGPKGSGVGFTGATEEHLQKLETLKSKINEFLCAPEWQVVFEMEKDLGKLLKPFVETYFYQYVISHSDILTKN